MKHKFISFVVVFILLPNAGLAQQNDDSDRDIKKTTTNYQPYYKDSESQQGVQFYQRAQKKPRDPKIEAYHEARRQKDIRKMREIESQLRRPLMKNAECYGEPTIKVSGSMGHPGEPDQTSESGVSPHSYSPDWGTDIHVRSVNTDFRESHPAMATASDGTIYIVWENVGQSGVNDYVQVYYSTDGGENWTAYGYVENPSYNLREPTLAIGEGGDNILMIAYIVDDGVCPFPEVATSPLISSGFNWTIRSVPYWNWWDGYAKPNLWTDSYDWFGWFGYLTCEGIYDGATSNSNVCFWRSVDYGVTWQDEQAILGDIEADAWRDPDGTYGTIANKLFVASFNQTDNTLYTRISYDFGATWVDTVAIFTMTSIPFNPVDPDIEAATNYDNVMLCCTKSFEGADNAAQGYSTDGGYTWSTLFSLEGYTPTNEFAIDLTANEGGNNWHVCYTSADWWVFYSTRPQDLSGFWQAIPDRVNDVDWASAAYPKKAITSNWGSDEAGIAWTDYREGAPDYDIYFDRWSAIGPTVPNDECATATIIPPPPFTDNVNTTLATPNPSDPVLSCGSGGGGNTVWYIYTPASSTWVSANTIGSNYDTVLGLFTGTCGALVEIDCNDDAVGLQSEIIWEAQGGVSYYILVAEYGGGSGGGNLVFNLDPVTPPALYQGPAFGSIPGGAPQNTSNFPLAPKTKIDSRKVLEKLIPYRETPLALATKYLPKPAAPRGSNEFDDLGGNPTDQPTLLNDFVGIPDDANSAGYSFIPPDPICAAGPDHIMACTNTDFAIFDKSGTKLQEIDATLWFENVLPGLDPGFTEPFGAAYDPQILYDHFADRWVMIYIADNGIDQSYLLISTSDDPNPFGMWCNFAIPGNANGSTFNTNVNDYPKLGVNQDALYVTANMFDLGGAGFQYVQVRFFGKNQFYNNTCGSISWTDFWDLRDPDNLSTVLNTGSTVVPAVTFGFPGVEYLINASPYVSGTFMTLWTLYDPLGAPYMTAVNLPVAAYDWPPDANQLGGGTPLIDVGGWRVRNAVYRDGYIWTAHSVADASLSFTRARYVKVDVAGPTLIEDVSYGLTDYWYYYPAITADAADNSIMVMNRSGTSEYAGIHYTGTLSGIPEPTVLLKAGEANYVKTFGGSRNRWGDYNGIAVDPANPDIVWMFAEYAASPDNTWGTWWGEVTFGPAPIDPPQNLYAYTGYSGAIPLAWDPPPGYPPFEHKDQTNLLISGRSGESPGLKQESWESTRIKTNLASANQSAKAGTSGPPSPSPEQTLLYYNLYRSTNPGGPYTLIASGINRQYYRDESAGNGSIYYYVVTAMYDIGESGYSNEDNGTPVAGGYYINSGWATTPPTLDGFISASEWASADVLDITYPGVTPPVTLHVMNDNGHLYLAVDDPGNTSLEDNDQFGFYFDEDHNREWPLSSPSGEGNFWIEWLTSTAQSEYRGTYGWWPANMGFDTPISATGVNQAISLASGHVQYETDIDLAASELDALPGDVIGCFIFSYILPSAVLTGNWPQEMIFSNWGDDWMLPAVYGDLELATFTPGVTVTWCGPPPLTGAPGTQDTVYVCVDDVTGLNIISYQLTATFDNTVLNCVGATSTGTLTEPFGPPTVNCAVPGEITVGGFGTSPISGSGQLVGLIFDVVGAPGATTDICFTNVLFNAGIPPATIPVPCIPFEIPIDFDIRGDVTYCPNSNPVPNVTMTLSGGASGTQPTDPSGHYEFNNLVGGLNYTVTPSKVGDVDPLFDISCYDAALSAQMALGIIPANHCDSLAADVDENGFIQTFDAALTCRFAVGLPPFGTFDHTGEWRFEPESIDYNPLTSDHLNEDYSAALLGDVDGNWIPAASLLTKDLPLAEPYEILRSLRAGPGEILSIPFMVEAGKEVISADIDFRYDPGLMRFVGVAKTGLSEGFEIISNAEEGRIRVGAFSAEAVSEAGELLSLKFEITAKERDRGALKLERYQLNAGTLKQAEVEFTVGVPAVPVEFALHQNYPNPFNPETTIRFDVPAVSEKNIRVRLSVYNISGQLVRTLLDEEREAGVHEIRWDSRDNTGNLVASGIYLYSISAGDFFATKKMMLLK